MNLNTQRILKKKKSKIGFFHGTLSIIGGILLGYLIMMVFSMYIPGDNAIKIMPSIIVTPIAICIAGLWLLFSKTTIVCILKILLLSIILIFFIKVF